MNNVHDFALVKSLVQYLTMFLFTSFSIFLYGLLSLIFRAEHVPSLALGSCDIFVTSFLLTGLLNCPLPSFPLSVMMAFQFIYGYCLHKQSFIQTKFPTKTDLWELGQPSSPILTRITKYFQTSWENGKEFLYRLFFYKFQLELGHLIELVKCCS